MRGVPSLMRPRMTSSLPPAVSLDNRGPKVRALICGGRWQIPQDWAKTCRPNFCVAVNPSSVTACCADALPSTPKRTTERTAERTAALRFILDPPDIAFFASLRRRGVKRKARPRTRWLDRHAFLRGAPTICGCGAGTGKPREATALYESHAVREANWISLSG